MRGLGVLLCSLHLSRVLAHCNPQHKSKSGFLMLSRKINTKFTVSRQNSKVSSKKVLRCFSLWKLNLIYCIHLCFINFRFLEITTLFAPLCILSITLISYTELPLESSWPTSVCLQLRRITTLVLCRQSPLNLHHFRLTRCSSKIMANVLLNDKS